MTTQWAIMWDIVSFPEPEEKRANFTSKQKKHVICSHNSLLYSKCVYFKWTIVLEHVLINIKHVYHAQFSWEKSILTLH